MSLTIWAWDISTLYCLLKRPFHRKVSQLRFFNCYCRTLFYNEFLHVKNLYTLLLYYLKKITSFAIRAIVSWCLHRLIKCAINIWTKQIDFYFRPPNGFKTKIIPFLLRLSLKKGYSHEKSMALYNVHIIRSGVLDLNNDLPTGFSCLRSPHQRDYFKLSSIQYQTGLLIGCILLLRKQVLWKIHKLFLLHCPFKQF